MTSTPTILRLLQILILLKRPRHVLEIGTFIGLSTLFMAKALPESSQIMTIEKYPSFADVARKNFRQHGVESRIQLIQGDAFEVLQRFDGTPRFDMVFLDGNKERYDQYFLLLDRLLLPQGLLVADDMLHDGDVFTTHPKTPKGQGVKAFLDLVEPRTDYRKVLLPISCGVMLLIKHAV